MLKFLIVWINLEIVNQENTKNEENEEMQKMQKVRKTENVIICK